MRQGVRDANHSGSLREKQFLELDGFSLGKYASESFPRKQPKGYAHSSIWISDSGLPPPI